jgi:hypothetical protein
MIDGECLAGSCIHGYTRKRPKPSIPLNSIRLGCSYNDYYKLQIIYLDLNSWRLKYTGWYRLCNHDVRLTAPNRMSAATLAHSIYGYNLQSADDPFLLGVKEATDNIGKAVLPSSTFLINGVQYCVNHPCFKTSWLTFFQLLLMFPIGFRAQVGNRLLESGASNRNTLLKFRTVGQRHKL